jgi:hypothetical protein
MDLRLLLVAAGAGAALWAFLRWRTALQLVMVLLVVEGAIRKWLFPGAQDLVYLGKDVILIGVYAGYLRQRGQLRYRPPALPVLYSVLAFAAVFGLLQIFNPNLPNLMVGAFGWKAYFLYVPILVVLPASFPTDRDLVTFLRRYIQLSIPVGILALAQFLSPASSSLNTYARTAEDTAGGYISTFGSSEFVRVTATFSYISGYASYLVAITIIVLSYLALTRWRLQGSVTIYVALGMAMLGMLMTGSRGPVFMLVLLFPLYWWLAVMRGSQGGATFGRLLIGLAMLVILINALGGDAVAAFRGRAASSGDFVGRITVPFEAPWEVLPSSGLVGYGIGATHQTATAFTQGLVPYSWLHGVGAEVESGRVMLELGPVGFFLVYFVRLFMIAFALQQVLVLRTTFHRAVATACLMFFLAQLLGSVIFDVTSDLYYWFFGGLLLTVMRLDRLAIAQAQRTAAAVRAPSAPQPRTMPVPAAAGRRQLGPRTSPPEPAAR